MAVKRFEVYLCRLDPTEGSEIRKTRPCVIVSPDEMNSQIRTCVVAPLTSADRSYPTRVPSLFDGKPGQVVLDQMRTLDERRLLRKMGTLDDETAEAVLAALAAMFAR